MKPEDFIKPLVFLHIKVILLFNTQIISKLVPNCGAYAYSRFYKNQQDKVISVLLFFMYPYMYNI